MAIATAARSSTKNVTENPILSGQANAKGMY